MLLRGALLAAVLAWPAAARTLEVGPGKEFARPSAAAREAFDGDTVLIEPGEYYDCAVWSASGLTIAGRVPGVVLTDTICQGKAVMVLQGDGVTVRDLTLARARSGEGNGAGVRLEAGSATFERVRFTNNQAGLLAVGLPGRIVVQDCTFEGGGVGGDRPTFAVSVGQATELHVDRSTFGPTAGGQVRTAARQTRLRGSSIAVSGPNAGVEASGGLHMEDNTLRLTSAAVAAVRVTGPAVLRHNRLVNETGQPVVLLLDWGGSPVLDGNAVPSGDAAVSTAGAWRHEASSLFHGAKADLRRAAGSAKRGLQELLR